MNEKADSWLALLLFLLFGLLMIVVMVPQFRVFWPQAQMFSLFGGVTVNPLLYAFVIICMVLMIAATLSFCVYRILHYVHRRKREGSL